MRIVNILCCLLLIFHTASADNYNLAQKLAALNAPQRAVLYQYNTLLTYATTASADSFWNTHAIPGITATEAKQLGNELMVNSELVYEVKQPSRIQTLRGLFTASRLLLGFAGLIMAYALVHLLGSYWAAIIRRIAPLIRILFSPILLTLQLLCAGLAGVYFGPQIGDVFFRTIMIHVAILLTWGQLTALFTQTYYIKGYWRNAFRSFEANQPLKHSIFGVFIPAFAATLLYTWVISQCNDVWYLYEIVFAAMLTICSFPLIRLLEKPLSHLIYPFPNNGPRHGTSTIAVMVIIWTIIAYLPIFFQPALIMLSLAIFFSLVTNGFSQSSRIGKKNYIYVQILAFLFTIAMIFIGTQRELTLLVWTGLGALFILILIKYWEWPVLFGWQWKNRKAWGLLGMALIIWGMATLLRVLPGYFPQFF